MVTKSLCIILLLTIISIILIGSLVIYWLFTKKVLYNNKETKNFDMKLLNNFVEKSINIYFDSKKETNKNKIQLNCYAIMFILKSLTGEYSDELYAYLNELEIKDLEGFKIFVIYLYSKLILENDTKKINKILQYFIDESTYIDNKKNESILLNDLYCKKSNEIDINNENNNFNLNDYNVSVNEQKEKSSYVHYNYNGNLSNVNDFTEFRKCDEDIELGLTSKIYGKNKNNNDELKNIKICEKFIDHILSLKIEENNDFLEKVNKKDKKSSSILENIFIKFLNRNFYYPTINDDLVKLIPNYNKREGNPFLTNKKYKENNHNFFKESQRMVNFKKKPLLRQRYFKYFISHKLRGVKKSSKINKLHGFKKNLKNQKLNVVQYEISIRKQEKFDTDISRLYISVESPECSSNLLFRLNKRSKEKLFVKKLKDTIR